MTDKVITSRHIRHDWQTWVNWHQASVKAVCGVKTRPGLAGIPGITPQPQTVPMVGVTKWGWCMRCVVETVRVINGIESQKENMHPSVLALYEAASTEIFGQYLWYNEQREAGRRISYKHNLAEVGAVAPLAQR